MADTSTDKQLKVLLHNSTQQPSRGRATVAIVSIVTDGESVGGSLGSFGLASWHGASRRYCATYSG